MSNTGTAWPAMLASLSGYGQWLLANPDPAKVETIAAPGCDGDEHESGDGGDGGEDALVAEGISVSCD
ncbi:hypothetical protein [Nucisporomicrobium flavum]|uniref:hypothetical protein n=1 Tax=Nucisporomicrobium flavum TaxID=2785915 RepID=UPI0018F5233A|nr:hypothetical protein [Nucisporomicrobium flavum]